MYMVLELMKNELMMKFTYINNLIVSAIFIIEEEDQSNINLSLIVNLHIHIFKIRC